MKEIRDQYFEGERPLYKSRDLSIDNITIGLGESSLKESRYIEANRCTFIGKYPLWETKNANIIDSTFRESARSGPWYSSNIAYKNCTVDAPKQFRKCSHIQIEDCKFSKAVETFWDCKSVTLKNVSFDDADYIFMHTDGISGENININGNYSFQYSNSVVLRNCILNSKDSFWDSSNVTLYNCMIEGEYLGWYSKNLTLINCTIGGTQPLCYCDNLNMMNCTLKESADLAFEYSVIHRVVLRGNVTSIKNPTMGDIFVDSVDNVIWDKYCKYPHSAIVHINGDDDTIYEYNIEKEASKFEDGRIS